MSTSTALNGEKRSTSALESPSTMKQGNPPTESYGPPKRNKDSSRREKGIESELESSPKSYTVKEKENGRSHIPEGGSGPKKKFRQKSSGDLEQHKSFESKANTTSFRKEDATASCINGRQLETNSLNVMAGKQNASTQKSRKITVFKPHLSETEVQLGLKSGALLKGVIRINQRKYEEAFINNPDGTDHADIAILGMPDRNRALHGDVVAVRLKPRASWVVNEEQYKAWKRESCLEKTGYLSTEETTTVSILLDDVISAVIRLESPVAPATSRSCRSRADVEDPELDSSEEERKCTEKQADMKMKTVTGFAGAEQYPVQNENAQNSEAVADAGKSSPSNGGKGKTAKRGSPYRVLSQLPLEDWMLPDSCLQKTAEVVGIVEKKNSRLATGKLEPASSTQRQWAKFSPTDSRIPRMMIDASQLPKDFFDRPQDFAKFLFVAKIAQWPDDSFMSCGILEKQLGLAGEIDVETEGLLITNEIDTREFSDEVLACLPSASSASGWQIDEEELAKRRDLRGEIIFTIDPKTARDLDDALSINPCDDVDGAGMPGWEIGVHIADVSYFVYENTALDEWASQRANSVYLVHEVIPMLPRALCEELCSLNAGVDRLTFSVIFKMDDKGNVYDEWFGRSVIRSRVKLTYEHAQDFIENPEKVFSDSEMPDISDGTTVCEIKQKVLQLHKIAKALREKRSQNGSLQLDQPKLKFALDDETKMPIGVSIYQAKDSNRLVEEFMLLANMAVARKIERHYRKTALLRLHPPPKAKILREAINLCNSIGFPINGTSSQQLSRSLATFRGNMQLLRSINQVLSMILMKAMELARYFCTGSVASQDSYHHFALNVPFYTHFTSPIRRYPDIIVHRLLAASLNYCEPSGRSVEEIQKIAEHCNDKKLTAKKVSEASAETFFGLLVQRVGPMEAKGVVVNVLDAAFDVLLFKYGVIKRVYINALEMSQEPLFQEYPNRLTLYWNSESGKVVQVIQMCTVVDVVLSGLPEPTKFQAVIKPRSREDSPTLIEMWRERQEPDDGLSESKFDNLLLD
ncbi:hypothetical protein RB195_003811 [Necator americanus]|uniref:DIS3-like exonuclease 2 n=1 Tax=Necator americanus TaxID=51031 RepID=A0ABR1DQC7_NECAM